MEGAIAGLPLKDAPPSKRTKASELITQGFGAVCWGVFFSVAPIYEVLVLGAIIWIPLFFFLESRRARKYGLFPGVLIRVAIIAAIVTGAIYYPAKHEDNETVEGPSGSKMTIADLGLRTRIHYPPEKADTIVTLPKTNPSLRQVIKAIETQTPLRCEIARCGNGATILGGAHIIMVSIRTPQ